MTTEYLGESFDIVYIKGSDTRVDDKVGRVFDELIDPENEIFAKVLIIEAAQALDHLINNDPMASIILFGEGSLNDPFVGEVVSQHEEAGIFMYEIIRDVSESVGDDRVGNQLGIDVIDGFRLPLLRQLLESLLRFKKSESETLPELYLTEFETAEV